MIETVHHTPEGALIKDGFNIFENDKMTDLRVIYNSTTTRWYFRIRSAFNQSIPKYIFTWENQN